MKRKQIKKKPEPIEDYRQMISRLGFALDDIGRRIEGIVNIPAAPGLTKIRCACCEIFYISEHLYREAAVEHKREIFCPRGHEISWRGGTLGARQKTVEAAKNRRRVSATWLAKEIRVHQKFVRGMRASMRLIKR